MENSEESDKKLETHEIEGLGGIRAHSGTALSTIAGAAAYWEKEAKTIENRVLIEAGQYVEKVSRTRWRDGFLTGAVSTATLFTAALFALRFFT